MIILITGASHTGKTLLARMMLDRLKYPYLSIDHLKMGLIRSGNTGLTPEDDDELTEYLWPIVREIIRTAAENRQDLTVEGCYIPFDWRADLQDLSPDSISFVCLVMTDRYIDSSFDKILDHESDIEHRFRDTGCTAEGLKEDNRNFAEGFARSGERIVLIDSDFEGTLQSVADTLYSQIKGHIRP